MRRSARLIISGMLVLVVLCVLGCAVCMIAMPSETDAILGLAHDGYRYAISEQCWESAGARLVPAAESLPDDATYRFHFIMAMTVDDGTLWAGVDTIPHAFVLAALDGKEWEVVGDIPTARSEKDWPSEMVVDSNGRVWVVVKTSFAAFDPHAVAVFSSDSWVVYDEANSGLPTNQVLDIDADDKGRVWLGTAHGAVKFENEKWTHYTTANSGLAGDEVRLVQVETVSRVWFVTNGGLTLLNDDEWTSHRYEDLAIDYDRITSMVVDEDGHPWFGLSATKPQSPTDAYRDDGGIAVFDGVAMSIFTEDDSGFVGGSVHDVAIDSQDRLWYSYTGSESQGIGVFDRHQWFTCGYPWDIGPGGLKGDADGQVWVATGSGVIRFMTEQ